MYLDYYYLLGLIMIPVIILSIYAQIKVNTTFNKYSKIITDQEKSSSEIIRTFLDTAGMQDINIVECRGYLTDNYNHRKKRISLSSKVYHSSSIAALGVACHELGHALQYKTNYFPIRLRNFIIPFCNFANKTLWVFIILGALFYYLPVGALFLWIVVGIFALTVLLNLITLPIEYNASNRALKMLSSAGILNDEELACANKVLRAAGLTYVAGLAVSITNLLRFVLLILIRRRD